ncbi:MAG: WD40 repeat domain-containing protein, partial [Verrucomicrobiae bacterium]|nr:WD40 repeat domain-containing protein [Verrucomicrobiae bacterium]
RRLLDKHRPREGQVDFRGWEWRYLWQQARGDASMEFLRRESQIVSLTSSPDGRWLAAGVAHRGGLSVIDLTGRQPETRLAGDSERLHAAFSPTDPLLAYTAVKEDADGTRRGSLHLWDTDRRALIASRPLDAECVGLAMARDGKSLVTSTSDGDAGTLTLWRLPGGDLRRSFPSRQFGGEIAPEAFAATRDLDLAAYALPRRFIRLVDLAGGGDVLWEPEVVRQFITALAFSPDGKTLAVAGGFGDSDIALWDV